MNSKQVKIRNAKCKEGRGRIIDARGCQAIHLESELAFVQIRVQRFLHLVPNMIFDLLRVYVSNIRQGTDIKFIDRLGYYFINIKYIFSTCGAKIQNLRCAPRRFHDCL